MKPLLRVLAILCLSVPANGATLMVPFETPEVAKSVLDCDTLILMSGVKIEGEILEEDEVTYRFAYCEKDRIVLLEKSDVREIRYASGKVFDARAAWLSNGKTGQGKKVDTAKRKKLIRTGLILMGIGLVSFFPLGYLAVILSFGGSSLAGLVLAIPFGVFLVGTVKLIKGLLIRKNKG